MLYPLASLVEYPGWLISVSVKKTIKKGENEVRSTAKMLTKAANQDIQLAKPADKAKDPFQELSSSASVIIRKLKDAEYQVLRAQQLAQVGQLAAGIAHEIRNPLMAIKFLIQAAAQSPRRALLPRQDWQVLEEEILRLEQIIQLFLDFARPPQPQKRSVDLIALLKTFLQSISPRAKMQEVELHLQSDVAELEIQIDPNQIRQVLYNLIYNALDVQPNGGSISIKVDVEYHDSAAENPNQYLNQDSNQRKSVVITITDQGVGIPIEILSRIFEPFVSSKDSGLGLGLSICKKIVDLHQGEISARNRSVTSESSKISGAEFVIRLPFNLSENQIGALPFRAG